MDHPLILIPLIVSPVFILAGCILWIKPPKNINVLYGYRTKSTMENQERWDYAQPLAGKEMVKFGVAYFGTLLLGFIFDGLPLTAEVLISLFLLIGGCIALVARLEKKMKKEFGPLK